MKKAFAILVISSLFGIGVYLLGDALLLGVISNDQKSSIKRDGDRAIVKVFFGTNRRREESSNLKTFYGATRGRIGYGFTEVSIPRDHRMGELESPSILRFEFKENPDKHIVLLSIDPRSKESFFEELALKLQSSNEKNVLVFIHGYNVTFEEAARRTAQISYDLAFSGAPIFFSWPSHGKFSLYPADEVNAKWSESHVADFLLDVADHTDAQSIYLIAHSMGNRILARAYADAASRSRGFKDRVREVILAAPDIDADVFKQDIAPKILAGGNPITLYASSNDLALLASRKFHGDYARAGDSGEQILIIQGIETIDSTNAETSFLGHSYYADERSVLSDIYNIIHHGHRANHRSGLIIASNKNGIYWKFRN